MRLAASDYRHPGELPALAAGLWFAATLMAALHLLGAWLLVARPLIPWLAAVLGGLLIVVPDVGLLVAIMRIGGHCAGLRASARPVGPTQFGRVHEAAERVAGLLGLPATPPVFVLPIDEPDSFTIAWRRPEVFVTQGLVETLDDLALRAALAHEMAHIKGGHVRLATLTLLPLRARLAHPVALVGHAIIAFALRGWVRVAELSADRAAAVACGGAEPVAHWLSVAVEESEQAAEADLHHYLTWGLDESDQDFAEAEIHVTHPGVAHRIIELARFVRSRRFVNCLAIAGYLRISPRPNVPDPASPGVAVFLGLGLLAGLWLAPVTVAITIALGAPQPVAPQSPPPPVAQFDPNAPASPPASTVEATPEEPVGEPTTPQTTEAEDLEGLIEIAKMHKNHGNLAAARRTLEDVIQRDPTLVEAHYLLAWVHASAGDKDLAAAEFTATINLADPESEMYREASDALERLGY